MLNNKVLVAVSLVMAGVSLFLATTLVLLVMSFKAQVEDWREVNTQLHSDINSMYEYYQAEIDIWFNALLECEQAFTEPYVLPIVPDTKRQVLEM